MGQVAIRRIDGAYYREYAIEPGDTLIHICLRFGHTSWYSIYHDLSVNQPFEDRFPNPDDIDFVNPVNFFIPLAGATTSGKKKKGAPIGDYLIARVENADGTPLAAQELVLVGPGLPAAGGKIDKVTTTAEGDVIVANPDPGDWYLVSPFFTLTPKASVGTIVPPRDVTAATPAPVISDPVLLTRNAVDTLVARPVYCLRCPMCWQIFAVTEQSPAGTGYKCPNDTFLWGTIVADIPTNLASFLSAPTPSQIAPASGCGAAAPATVPSRLLCRGVEAAPLKSLYGDARVFWDESRFVEVAGGDYQLWGKDAAGTVRFANVKGRGTWGANPPVLDGTRLWDFHRTNAGCSSPAHSYAIPNNEVTPLRDTFKWATIHHTAGSAGDYPTPNALQTKHQVEGTSTGGPAADIGYHFFIDTSGVIFEARPLGMKGSHVNKFNGGNVGIVITGNFEAGFFGGNMIPTLAQRNAMDTIARAVAARFGIKSIWYHHERDIQTGKSASDATECPGSNMIPYAAAIRALFPGPPP